MPKKKKKKRPAQVSSKSKTTYPKFGIVTIIVLIVVAAFFILNNLIKNGKTEVEYYQFKKQLAKTSNNIVEYSDAKSDFIQRIIKKNNNEEF